MCQSFALETQILMVYSHAMKYEYVKLLQESPRCLLRGYYLLNMTGD